MGLLMCRTIFCSEMLVRQYTLLDIIDVTHLAYNCFVSSPMSNFIEDIVNENILVFLHSYIEFPDSYLILLKIHLTWNYSA